MTTTTSITDFYTKEASSLGWAPGVWPERAFFATPAFRGSFARTSARRDAEGDLLYVRYVAPNGVNVVVYND
jgi:hypothetical protein